MLEMEKIYDNLRFFTSEKGAKGREIPCLIAQAMLYKKIVLTWKAFLAYDYEQKFT